MKISKRGSLNVVQKNVVPCIESCSESCSVWHQMFNPGLAILRLCSYITKTREFHHHNLFDILHIKVSEA